MKKKEKYRSINNTFMNEQIMIIRYKNDGFLIKFQIVLKKETQWLIWRIQNL